MTIGLIDVDSHNFPNLALMKISAYHKAKGDFVEWCEPLKHYDIVYQSKVFGDRYSKDIDYIPNADVIHKGGTGYAIVEENGVEVYHKEIDFNLPSGIEHQYPDYSLYPELTKDTAYGFLTRGCPNNCDFCIVSKKENRCSVKVADLNEFWNGQKNIVILDPNLLACKDRVELIQQLIDSKAKITFNQGLDARFMTEEIADMLHKCRINIIHFAFDSMKNEKAIVKGLEIFGKKTKMRSRGRRVYILTNFDTDHKDDWYRVNKIIELGYQPFIMIYRKGTHDRFLTDLSRWCNNPFIFKSVSFEDYAPRVDGKTCLELYGDIINES